MGVARVRGVREERAEGMSQRAQHWVLQRAQRGCREDAALGIGSPQQRARHISQILGPMTMVLARKKRMAAFVAAIRFLRFGMERWLGSVRQRLFRPFR